MRDDAALRALAAAIHPVHPRPEPLATDPKTAATAVRLAADHRVGPLLAWRLEQAELLDRLEASARHALRKQLLDAELSRAGLRLAAARVASALSRAGLRVVLLKGAAIGELAYERPSLRPMTDVDVLIEPSRFDDVLRVLRDEGLGVPSDDVVAFWREAYSNVPVGVPGELDTTVEIHWSIAQEGRHTPDVEGMIDRARSLSLEGIATLALDPTDLLLHQVLHHAYHTFEPKLIWLHDIARLHLDPPQVADIVARAERWGMSIPLEISTAQVEKVFPGCVSPVLREALAPRWRTRWLLRRHRSEHPVEILEGWQRRRTQLAVAFLSLDRPGQMARSLAGWARRTLKHGEGAGRKMLRAH